MLPGKVADTDRGRFKRCEMQEQEFTEHEQNPTWRRAGTIVGVLACFWTVGTIWNYGLRNWEWVQNATFALLGFSIASGAWQFREGGSLWRWRVFWVAYGLLFGAWTGHEN